MLGGAFLYATSAKDQKLLQQYGVGTPDDWLERKVYTPHPWLGVGLMLIIDLVLFGVWGFLIWGIQMIWIPFWAAGIINGVGHFWGYRNGETRDRSRNISPWGILIGGEELHNNHHLEPANPKLSHRWWEIDLGWNWLKLFEFLHLAKIRYKI